MIVAPRANAWSDLAPGFWYRTLMKDGTRTAWFRCPNGHYGTLTDHEIAADGTVSPSVACPEPGCTFHDMVKLDGWTP